MQESKGVVEKAPKTWDVIDIDGNQYVAFLDTEMKPAGTNPSQCLDFRQNQTVQKGNKFVLCVEVNAPHDPNETWTDAVIGRPSLLYTALIKVDEEQRYHLLELTGHGGGAEASGDTHYDLEGIGSAKHLVDLLLAKLEVRRWKESPCRLVCRETLDQVFVRSCFRAAGVIRETHEFITY